MSDLFFGNIQPPPGIEAYGSQGPAGLITLLNNIVRLAIFAGAFISLINIIISGIEYIGSAGNPDTIKKASSRIWISLLGLVVIAASIVIAAIIGLIFFNDPQAILSPTIPQL